MESTATDFSKASNPSQTSAIQTNVPQIGAAQSAVAQGPSAPMGDITPVSTEFGSSNYSYDPWGGYFGGKVQAGLPGVGNVRVIGGPFKGGSEITSPERTTIKERDGFGVSASLQLGDPSWRGLQLQYEGHGGDTVHTVLGVDGESGQAEGSYDTDTVKGYLDFGPLRFAANGTLIDEEVDGTRTQLVEGDADDPLDNSVRHSSYSAELNQSRFTLLVGGNARSKVGPKGLIFGQPTVTGDLLGGISLLKATAVVEEVGYDTAQPGVETTTNFATESLAFGPWGRAEGTAGGGNGLSASGRLNGANAWMARLSFEQEATVSTTMEDQPYFLTHINKTNSVFAEDTVEYDRTIYDLTGDAAGSVARVERGRATDGLLVPDTRWRMVVETGDDGSATSQALRATVPFFVEGEAVETLTSIAPDGVITQTEQSNDDGYLTDVERRRITVVEPSGAISVTRVTDIDGIGANQVTTEQVTIDSQGNVFSENLVEHSGALVDDRAELVTSIAKVDGNASHFESVTDIGWVFDTTESAERSISPALGVLTTFASTSENRFITNTSSLETHVNSADNSIVETQIETADGPLGSRSRTTRRVFDGEQITGSTTTEVDNLFLAPTTTVEPADPQPVSGTLTLTDVVSDPLLGPSETFERTYFGGDDGVGIVSFNRVGDSLIGVGVDTIRNGVASSSERIDEGYLSSAQTVIGSTTSTPDGGQIAVVEHAVVEHAVSEHADVPAGASTETVLSAGPDAANVTREAETEDRSDSVAVNFDGGHASVVFAESSDNLFTDETTTLTASVSQDGDMAVSSESMADGWLTDTSLSQSVTSDADSNLTFETVSSIDRLVHVDRLAASTTNVDSNGVITGLDLLATDSIFSPIKTAVTPIGAADASPSTTSAPIDTPGVELPSELESESVSSDVAVSAGPPSPQIFEDHVAGPGAVAAYEPEPSASAWEASAHFSSHSPADEFIDLDLAASEEFHTIFEPVCGTAPIGLGELAALAARQCLPMCPSGGLEQFEVSEVVHLSGYTVVEYQKDGVTFRCWLPSHIRLESLV